MAPVPHARTRIIDNSHFHYLSPSITRSLRCNHTVIVEVRRKAEYQLVPLSCSRQVLRRIRRENRKLGWYAPYYYFEAGVKIAIKRWLRPPKETEIAQDAWGVVEATQPGLIAYIDHLEYLDGIAA